ncbi:peptide ABC transporter ATP-binding protein [Malaciobacter molluscorum LMG 25693]|uniref:ABC transporter, ATP-binding protein, FtsE/LolD family n=1 Tax=Malaciobacter molluscorum LMG 25693 TaxID=870501 RepID=A0A2G1DHB7_9BACT|nr:ABC transporter ATP-binding protein [Malaciobacter molluscorum]AXX93692.1 ABC transporter, ATP-binding protein, FtsE/LolD family [Malaciobacter molluscorum LMG 25693]PHO17898.1 peptide ABC transporter ATP-binding protein [Malaciobacter molluscorum LMG 25693]RXJ93631.1 peptide ABC transporter ATP-binding protein [Malaciobacter molluscorum]
MIKIKNISHKYEKDFVLKNINLEIKRGSFIAITGESGSGKTTLLSILSTLLKPTSGDLYFEGINYKDIKNIDEFRQKNIGFIFQFHYLINYLTVKENIQLANEKASDKKIEQVLKQLHIENLIDSYANEISGGQRQRVAIARALINNPKIIFADEPTGNLDSKNSLNVFNIFQELIKQGVTLVVATHDKNLASLANINIEVKDGQL